MTSNWNINRDKISTSWGRRELPWCQATTAKRRRWNSEIILSYTQRLSHGLLCATTCSGRKEDVPATRRRRRHQIRSEHWARDFLFCTLIAICQSIHPSSLSHLPWTCVNWREAASIEESLECFDYGTHTLVFFSLLGHTHSCTVAFRDFTSVGRCFEWSKTAGSGSLTNSGPENLGSFSWGVPE